MSLRLSLRSRLIALLLIPVMVLMTFATVQLLRTRALAAEAATYTDLVGTSAGGFDLLHQLQVERTRTLEARFSDSSGGDMTLPALATARAATEESRGRFDAISDATFLASVNPGLVDMAGQVRTAMEEVDAVRASLDQGGATPGDIALAYDGATDAVFALDDAISAELVQAAIAQRLEILSSFVRLKTTIAERGDAVLLGAAGVLDGVGTGREVVALASQQEVLSAVVRRNATDEEVERLERAMFVSPLGVYNRVTTQIRTDSLPTVEELATTTVEDGAALLSEQLLLTAAATDTAAEVQSDANAQLTLLVGLAMGALALVALVFVSLTRGVTGPLRRLTENSQRIGRDLPATVDRIASGGRGETMLDDETFKLAQRKDELGELARAFTAATNQAVTVAIDQARTREGVSRTIQDIAQREQSLVEQQLVLLDRLEDAERDPDQLANLFSLDHLATRMRRNAENLRLFATGDLPGNAVDPVLPLVDVVRGAIAEIEDYVRVDVRSTTSAAVVGYATTPLSHLVAEIVENATQYSPPNSRVMVSTMLEGESAVITVRDHGLGMTPDEMSDAQMRLQHTPLLDAAESRRLGLYVVGLIANRLGISIAMSQPQEGRGLQVQIRVPGNLLVQDAAIQPMSFGSGTGGVAPVRPGSEQVALAAGQGYGGNGQQPPARVLPPRTDAVEQPAPVGLSLARESAVAARADVDQSMLGGFFAPDTASIPTDALDAVLAHHDDGARAPAPAAPPAASGPPLPSSLGAWSTYPEELR